MANFVKEKGSLHVKSHGCPARGKSGGKKHAFSKSNLKARQLDKKGKKDWSFGCSTRRGGVSRSKGFAIALESLEGGNRND